MSRFEMRPLSKWAGSPLPPVVPNLILQRYFYKWRLQASFTTSIHLLKGSTSLTNVPGRTIMSGRGRYGKETARLFEPFWGRSLRFEEVLTGGGACNARKNRKNAGPALAVAGNFERKQYLKLMR